MDIHEKIKARRLELDMSLSDVAEKLGVSKMTVQRYETKAIENMGIDKLEKLAKALQVSPAYLMGWTDNPGTDETEFAPQIDESGEYSERMDRKELENLRKYIEEIPVDKIQTAEEFIGYLISGKQG